MKLYNVVLRGMTYDTGAGFPHGNVYVLADSTNEAYQKVKDYLDQKNLGFHEDRELDHVKLVAESGDYPNCSRQLFL